jgi:hypothetical protein
MYVGGCKALKKQYTRRSPESLGVWKDDSGIACQRLNFHLSKPELLLIEMD